MILVDTSVWIDHLRSGDPQLMAMLDEGGVACHSFVIGELACGNLKQRDHVLALLHDLPRLPAADDDEVLVFIERHKLAGKGIGYVDAHLLTAAALAGKARLWTRDRSLRAAAQGLSMAANELR